MAYKSKQRNFKKRETKEEFAARKKAEKEAAYDTIDDSITEMMNDDESFISYLDFQSRILFPYSEMLQESLLLLKLHRGAMNTSVRNVCHPQIVLHICFVRNTVLIILI